MKREWLLGFVCTILILSSAIGVNAAEPVRIDGSTDASAQASWTNMLESVNVDKKQELIVAFVKLSLVGVNSAFELARDPERQSFSIAAIKDQVDGLTADEIIELSNEVNSTIDVEVHKNEH